MSYYANRSGYTRRSGGYSRPVYKTPFGGATTYTALSYKRKRPIGTITGGTTGAPVRAGRRVRYRMRTGASYTLTQTQKRRKFGKSYKTGDNSSISALRYGRALSRWLKQQFKRLQGRKTVNTITTVTRTSGTGQQTVQTFDALSKTDLDVLKAAIQDGQVGAIPANDVRMFIGYLKQRTVFKNQSNCAGKVLVYDIVSTRTPVNGSFDLPHEAWARGINDMGTPNGHLTVGSTPHLSPEFRRYFRVVRVSAVPLEPGQQHEHTVYRRINRMVSSTLWDQSSSVTVPGITHHQMLVWHGSLGHESADPTAVSYMPVKLDMAVHTTYNYGYLDHSSPQYSNLDSMVKTVADWDFMGENQDQDLDHVTA